MAARGAERRRARLLVGTVLIDGEGGMRNRIATDTASPVGTSLKETDSLAPGTMSKFHCVTPVNEWPVVTSEDGVGEREKPDRGPDDRRRRGRRSRLAGLPERSKTASGDRASGQGADPAVRVLFGIEI
jgi:hypothetical protein